MLCSSGMVANLLMFERDMEDGNFGSDDEAIASVDAEADEMYLALEGTKTRTWTALLCHCTVNTEFPLSLPLPLPLRPWFLKSE